MNTKLFFLAPLFALFYSLPVIADPGPALVIPTEVKPGFVSAVQCIIRLKEKGESHIVASELMVSISQDAKYLEMTRPRLVIESAVSLKDAIAALKKAMGETYCVKPNICDKRSLTCFPSGSILFDKAPTCNEGYRLINFDKNAKYAHEARYLDLLTPQYVGAPLRLKRNLIITGHGWRLRWTPPLDQAQLGAEALENGISVMINELRDTNQVGLGYIIMQFDRFHRFLRRALPLNRQNLEAAIRSDLFTAQSKGGDIPVKGWACLRQDCRFLSQHPAPDDTPICGDASTSTPTPTATSTATATSAPPTATATVSPTATMPATPSGTPTVVASPVVTAEAPTA